MLRVEVERKQDSSKQIVHGDWKGNGIVQGTETIRRGYTDDNDGDSAATDGKDNAKKRLSDDKEEAT